MRPSKTASSGPPTIVSPFRRLALLLDGIAPGRPEIDLTVGEPGHAMPGFLMEALAEAAAAFAKYPPIWGTDELRQAIADWLVRRYPGLGGKIDADRHVLPLAGSREGLFSAIFPAKQRKPAADRPAVLIPNPFYHTYAAAAGAAEIEAVFVPAAREAGFLPDLDGLDAALLDRTVALFLATPSNPEGAVADDAYLSSAIGLARTHDFMLFADECYSEIYADAPPPGALEVSAKAHGDLRNVISFNSLSKRSNLPGLRSGFCAGDPAFLGDYAGLRNVACPQLPLPIQHASARIWSDEAHVAQSRALYAEKLDIADRLLAGHYGYRRPQGGFFLWLDMSGHGGGEAATQTLWKECGVKVVPGGYLARDTDDGNPGADFVRVALVADVATTERGLRRIVETLQ